MDLEEVYTQICTSLKKYIHTRPRDYFVATPQQVHCDSMRVARTRKIPFRLATLVGPSIAICAYQGLLEVTKAQMITS